MSSESIFLILFLLGVVAILLFDLGVFTRQAHTVRFREALTWTAVWVSLGLGFYLFLRLKGELIHGLESVDDFAAYFARYGHNSVGLETKEQFALAFRKLISLEYLTGYLIEYSLSVDNVFVILMVFLSFGIREKHYKWILFWGVLGAVVMRFIFIFVGAALIQRFEWVLYIFGAFLLGTGVVMFLQRKHKGKIDPQHHPVVRIASRYFAVYPRNVGKHFFVRRRGKGFRWAITPLLLVLLVVEFTDVVFAFDSIPAIFGITHDPYIVFFSNIFAIIGLRSLFFLVANLMHKVAYLKTGLAVLLGFIGAKMLLHNPYTHIEIPVTVSLYVVLGILLVSVLASVFFPPRGSQAPGPSR